MPLYDIECDACSVVTEVLVRSLKELDDELSDGVFCTQCDVGKMTRLPSQAAFGINGSFVTKLGGGASTRRDNSIDDFDDHQLDR